MGTGIKKKEGLDIILHILYFTFFTSLIFSLRAISSISIAAILLVGIFDIRSVLNSPRKNSVIYFLSGCIAFFLLTLIAQLYSENVAHGWDHIRLKTGLVVIPLAVYLTHPFIRLNRQKLLLYFSVILAAACLCCLFVAIIFSSGFFYHELVHPLLQHAVYFSIYIFIALVFLLEGIRTASTLLPKFIAFALSAFFSIFLLLLGSKLVIVLFLLYFLFFLLGAFREKGKRKMILGALFLFFLAGTAGLLFTDNAISKRFREIVKSDINITRQENFEPGDYFDGLQLRLLEWRFVSEILTEKQRWLYGVGPGDGQALLDKKYISKNMYTGDPVRGGQGYLGYNTHNQFLQSLLQHGIIGVLVFTIIWVAMIVMMWKFRDRGYTGVMLLLLVYAGVESVFETQYGIVLFTFFPLFLLNYGNPISSRTIKSETKSTSPIP